MDKEETLVNSFYEANIVWQEYYKKEKLQVTLSYGHGGKNSKHNNLNTIYHSKENIFGKFDDSRTRPGKY